MRITLEPLDYDLVETFAQLVVGYYQDDPGAFPMTLARARRQAMQMLSRPEQVQAMLIQMDAGTVGYVLLVPYYSNEFGGQILWIDELYLRAAWRGQGLGSEVLDALKEICAREGFVRLELEVHHHNVNAKRLYERHGFELETRYLLGYQPAPPSNQD